MKKYKTKYKYKKFIRYKLFLSLFQDMYRKTCNVILAGGKGHELVNVVMWSND